MKQNVEKVLDRDAKLSELDDRAGKKLFFKLQTSSINTISHVITKYQNTLTDALQQGASQFEQQAKSLKNKFWLQNLKVI